MFFNNICRLIFFKMFFNNICRLIFFVCLNKNKMFRICINEIQTFKNIFIFLGDNLDEVKFTYNTHKKQLHMQDKQNKFPFDIYLN